MPQLAHGAAHIQNLLSVLWLRAAFRTLRQSLAIPKPWVPDPPDGQQGDRLHRAALARMVARNVAGIVNSIISMT